MNTRSYRLNRLALELELYESRIRLALELELYESRIRRQTNEALVAGAQLGRSAPGVAPLEPQTLMALFASTPATAWAALAGLTQAQLINQAIETTCWLETTGVVAQWGDVLARWEKRLAEQAGQQQAAA